MGKVPLTFESYWIQSPMSYNNYNNLSVINLWTLKNNTILFISYRSLNFENDVGVFVFSFGFDRVSTLRYDIWVQFLGLIAPEARIIPLDQMPTYDKKNLLNILLFHSFI